jgi:hypothetical protein
MNWGRIILLWLVCVNVAGETLPAPRRLNNLVVEVLRLEGEAARGIQNVRFTMPYDGWVYLAARRAPADGIGARVFLWFDNDSNERLGLRADGERQSFLEAGEHVLHVDRAGGEELAELILRRVPEVSVSKFGTTPRTLSAGDHDWDFWAKHLLPHLNTVIGMERAEQFSYVRQWKARGGRWFVELPRVVEPSKAFGITNPFVDGVLIDEFSAGMEVPEITTDKEVRLYFVDQTNGAIDFAKAALARGYKMVWEKYLGEFPSEIDEQARLERDLAGWMRELRKEVPIEKSVLCLGFFSAPPLTLNRSAEVDFKVWMDRQFQMVATDPAFLGLRALMEYQTRTTDEETLRWVGLLFRHYGLEGKTNLLSERYGFKYRLEHLRNADFKAGVEGWTVEPEGAAKFERRLWLGSFQGKYPVVTNWDGALLVEGAAEISQTVSNLVKGQQYSAKLISLRRNDLTTTNSEAAYHPVELMLEGAGKMPECGWRDVVPFTRKPFSAEKPLWIDIQQVVFFAEAETARLMIRVKAEAGLLINSVEVQPYLPRESQRDYQMKAP